MPKRKPSQPIDRAECGHRDRDRGEYAEPWPDAELEPQKRADIGAEPDVKRVPERKLARKAHHQIPGLPHIGEVEDQDQHRQQIAVGKERRREQHDEQSDEQPRVHAD